MVVITSENCSLTDHQYKTESSNKQSRRGGGGKCGCEAFFPTLVAIKTTHCLRILRENQDLLVIHAAASGEYHWNRVKQEQDDHL